MKRVLALIFAVLVASPVVAKGKRGGGSPAASVNAGSGGTDGSKKSLDFDGEVVEGMNRQPLDSLTSLSEGSEGGSKHHLYKRKKKPKMENRELAREIVETY